MMLWRWFTQNRQLQPIAEYLFISKWLCSIEDVIHLSYSPQK